MPQYYSKSGPDEPVGNRQKRAGLEMLTLRHERPDVQALALLNRTLD
jgi:hypothetical protein